jgi:hypothetical protein
MRWGIRRRAEMSTIDIEERVELQEFAANLERVADALPEDEREEYEAARESVVDARRSAELNEGLLQLR